MHCTTCTCSYENLKVEFPHPELFSLCCSSLLSSPRRRRRTAAHRYEQHSVATARPAASDPWTSAATPSSTSPRPPHSRRRRCAACPRTPRTPDETSSAPARRSAPCSSSPSQRFCGPTASQSPRAAGTSGRRRTTFRPLGRTLPTRRAASSSRPRLGCTRSRDRSPPSSTSSSRAPTCTPAFRPTRR